MGRRMDRRRGNEAEPRDGDSWCEAALVFTDLSWRTTGGTADGAERAGGRPPSGYDIERRPGTAGRLHGVRLADAAGGTGIAPTEGGEGTGT
jgi:hypothetical protein